MKMTALGAICALILATGSASSADLGVVPAMKAPAMLPTNWTGLYVGLNGGSGIISADFLDVDCLSCSDTKFQTGFGTFGGQVGYNWQWNSVVLGAESDFNWLNIDEHRKYALDNGAGTANFKFNEFGTIRSRAGLAVDRGLIYVTGGAAFGHFNSSTNMRGQLVPPSALQFNSFDNAWHTGLAAGVGLELMFAPNWIFRGEYLHLAFRDTLSPWIATTGRPSCGATQGNCRLNYGYSTDMVRVGLSYRLATGSALSADLGVMPAIKAPASLPTNWTGLYIGLNGGGGIASAVFADPDCFACTDTKFQAGFGTFGGQLGYNWQWNSVVLGAESDFNWLNIDAHRKFALAANSLAGTANFKFDEFGTVRGRAGVAVDRELIYVTGGLAFGHFNSWTNFGGQASPPVAVQDNAFDNTWHTGLAAGVGLEFMFAPNWIFRGEYLHLAFPDVLSPLTATNGVPTCGAVQGNCRMSYGYSADMVRAGLSYRLATNAALSADFGAKPAMKASAVPTNWTGLYVGLNGGGGIASADFFDPDCNGCANTKFQTGFGTFGGQLGYNWQWSSVVLGAESDFNWLNVDAHRKFALNDFNSAGTANFKFDEFGTVRGRAGLAVDRGLIYVTGGAAFGHFNSSTNLGGQKIPLAAVQQNSFDNAWHTGLAAGVGLELMFAPNWILRGEYLHLAFRDVLSPLTATNAVPPCGVQGNCRMNYGYSVELARIGLSYRLF